MFRTVNYYNGSEFQNKDLMDAQAFAQEGVGVTAADAIGPGQYYAGLVVTEVGPTSAAVAPGRLLDGGNFYDLPADADLPGTAGMVVQLSSHLPIVQSKVVALCVWGREIETDLQQRSFRLSLESPQVEFRTVPVRSHREAVIEVVDDGTESTTPQLPSIPDGLLHFCSVWLDPTGITKIEMVAANKLPMVIDLIALLREIELWKLQIEAQVETLRELMAIIRELLLRSAKHVDVINMILDVALLKRYANLPDTYSTYSADTFISIDNSDTAVTTYDALVEDGLLFPTEASTAIAVELLSPSDNTVKVTNGLMLPTYDEAARFSTGDWDGTDTPMAVEQSTWEHQSIDLNTWVHAKGWSFNHYTDWWASQSHQARRGARYDHPGRFSVPSYPAYWWKDWMMNWSLQPINVDVLVPDTTTVTGAALAQSFIAPAMWLTGIELFFTSTIDTDVSVFLCPITKTGKPDFSEVFASSTLTGEDLNTHPTGTVFTLNTPVFLQSGVRYAVVVVSAGVQRLATLQGAKFTQGTLFSSTSGAFFQGDQSKDLVMNLWGARFKYPRSVVSLQPISLAGGISDLKFNLQKRVPSGCELEIQYQVGGVWYTFGEDNNPLATLPALVPLRAVFVGTDSVQPALKLTADAIRGSRAKLAFTHFSELRTLATGSTDFVVKVRSHGFIQATHTLGCELVEPGDIVHTPATTTLLEDQDGSTLHQFNFSLGAAITQYRVKLTGTRPSATTAPFAVVERIEAAL